MWQQSTAYSQPIVVDGDGDFDADARDSLSLAENAAWRLAWEHPHWSALTGVTAAQRGVFYGLLIFLAASAAFAPETTFIMLQWLLAAFFLLVVVFRIVLLGAGFYTAVWRRKITPQMSMRSDAELPVYTVLSPLYHEPESVPQLIAALSHLNYPVDRLDIKLVLEADDDLTLNALRHINLPQHFEVLRVPPLAPRTKPKACNYALALARGEYVVIYDAEDIPAPNQLRKAAAAFDAGPPLLACLQARLNFYNPRENWLTRQFTLEYSMWFDWLLPGLQALGLPIPLGGTSNHFRARILRKIGGWDSYNVTEDADLGIRLARKGYSCAVLDSTTMEEANCRAGNWLRQRTRWQKGYILTWLVHMRAPHLLWRQLGPKGFFGFQLFIGGTVALALAMPTALVIFIVGGCVCGPALWFSLVNLNEIIFSAGLTVSALSATAGAVERKHYDLLPDILLTPAYWGLTMAASVRAVWQYFNSPFTWEKTRHGISKITAPTLQHSLD